MRKITKIIGNRINNNNKKNKRYLHKIFHENDDSSF